ncbi:hypothetical protein [Sporosarcina sp. FSL W7-1283]|uniref:hypothetical protein n=1 Tax=Sporosarcina sp. FSL W7-1283 TaxID=2921560 RepID=UPI0030F97F96
MKNEIKRGTLRYHINTIYTLLRKDEYLMRLLYYKPESSELEDSLEIKHILDNDDYWNIVDERIMTTTKSSEIEKEELCRLYIYPGRRRSDFNSYVVADQEIVIDVLVHDSYSSDLRTEWIADRLNELIALERITGFGKVEFAAANQRDAPTRYDRYQLVYTIKDGKK